MVKPEGQNVGRLADPEKKDSDGAASKGRLRVSVGTGAGRRSTFTNTEEDSTDLELTEPLSRERRERAKAGIESRPEEVERSRD